jgi:hypothetical protein
LVLFQDKCRSHMGLESCPGREFPDRTSINFLGGHQDIMHPSLTGWSPGCSAGEIFRILTHLYLSFNMRTSSWLQHSQIQWDKAFTLLNLRVEWKKWSEAAKRRQWEAGCRTGRVLFQVWPWPRSSTLTINHAQLIFNFCTSWSLAPAVAKKC